ncbi:hypothetical protein GCM10012284_02040 [Mangrovihabitans endophyticus]|uniref:Uncharacterized protein n=1 Tax=Mangrovihabitans endophyticus TaxID=1751298 RepID=A0A8J3FKL7_9ACTN|nr:hypothetical protein GCM10012284_02040 [Mangrovihabitans endophyticus]
MMSLIPVVTDGGSARHVVAGSPRAMVAAHTTGPNRDVRVAGEWRVRRASGAPTCGPATTRRIAISHSDHLRRSWAGMQSQWHQSRVASYSLTVV